MPYQLGLPRTLAKYGLTVETVPGWETRGDASFNPKGSVNHHTAGPAAGVRPSLKLVTDGRKNPDGSWNLKGPLCNVFLDRNGVAVVVAAGRANHAGAGGFAGLVGNSSVFGTEAESTGIGPNPWTDAQLVAYPRVVAAYHDLMNQKNASTNCNHKTWAPTRKVDCASLTDVWFRDQANLLLNGVDDELTPEDRALLNGVNNKLDWVLGQFGFENGQWVGKEVSDGTGRKLTLWDTLRETHRELNQRLPNRTGDVNAKGTDTIGGNAANADGYGYRLERAISALTAKVDSLIKK